MGKEEAAEVIGDSLIPVINKLQDIFSQVRPSGRVRDAAGDPVSLAAPRAAAAGLCMAKQCHPPSPPKLTCCCLLHQCVPTQPAQPVYGAAMHCPNVC